MGWLDSVLKVIGFIAAPFTGGASLLWSIASNIAISYVLNKFFGPDEPQQQPDPGVKQRIPTSTKNKIPVVYGRKRVAGQIIYPAISADNQKMAFIIALSEGPISKCNTVQWDDKILELNGDVNTGLRNVTKATDYDDETHTFLNDGRCKIRVYANGGECSEMLAFDSSKWGSKTRPLTNVAYAYVEITYDQKERLTGLTNNLRFDINGRLVKTINSATSISSTTSYSVNPAECLLDYMTNETYGAGISMDEIDLPSFFAHKTFCASNVGQMVSSKSLKTLEIDPANGGNTGSLIVGIFGLLFGSRAEISAKLTSSLQSSSLISGMIGILAEAFSTGLKATTLTVPSDLMLMTPRFTTNGVVNTNQDIDYNLSDLSRGNGATITWTTGKFAIITDKVTDTTASFSETNIVGDLSITGAGFNAKLNELVLRFDSIQAREEEEQVELFTPESAKNANEPRLNQQVRLPFTNNGVEATRLGTIQLNKSRQSLVVEFQVTVAEFGVTAGDVIEVSHKTPGWISKKFLVQTVREVLTSEGGLALDIVANEYANEVYEDSTLNEGDPAPNTGHPDPYATPTVTNFVAVEDTTIPEANISLSWSDAGSVFNDKYVIGYKVSTANDNTFVFKTVTGGLRYSVSPLVPNTGYTVSIKPISTLGVEGNAVLTAVTTGISRASEGAAGPSGVSNRLDIAFSPNVDGSGAVFPTGLLTGNVDAIKIVLADAADSTGDEMFIKKVVGTSDNHFLKNTGTATGVDMSFWANTTNGATGSTVRLSFNQPANTTVEAQVDAMISDYNSIDVLGSSSATTIGSYTLQRNSVAVKIDNSSFQLLRLTNDSQTDTPTFVVSPWNGGTPTVTNESVQRNTYSQANSRIDDAYFMDHLVTWTPPVVEPSISTTPSDYTITEIKGEKGVTGDVPFSIYRYQTSLPDAPTGGSYNSSTDVLTPPSGWSQTVSGAKVIGSVGKLYQSNTFYQFRNNTLTAWQDPFDVGQGAPQLTALAVNDKGTSGNNKNFDITSTLTDDEGNTSTITSNEFGLPDKFAGLSDVSITATASTDMVLYWDASSDTVQQISYNDLIAGSYLPPQPGSNGAYHLTKSGSAFTWVVDSETYLPNSQPTTTGKYVLNRSSGGAFSWAASSGEGLPTAPTSNGSYNLKLSGTNLTWDKDNEVYLPDSEPGSNGKYVLNVNSGTQTWVEDTSGIPIVIANPTTALLNTEYIIDTASSVSTITMPTGQSVGDRVVLRDLSDNAGTNNVTVAGAFLGTKIDGSTDDYVFNTDGFEATLVWVAGNPGWEVYESTSGGVGYLPASKPGNSKNYNLKIDSSGVASWDEDSNTSYLPNSAPSNGNKYNLQLTSGVGSWVQDFIPVKPSIDGRYNLLKSGTTFSWANDTDNIPQHPGSNGKYVLNVESGTGSWVSDAGAPSVPAGNGEYNLKIASGVATWVTDGIAGVTLPNTDGRFLLNSASGVFTWVTESPTLPSTDGEYAVSRTAGNFSYFKPDSFKLPDIPTGNGEYILKLDGTSYTWIDESGLLSLPDEPTSNGVYALTRSGGTSTWTDQSGTLSLPSAPSSDGKYDLKLASGIASWQIDAGENISLTSDNSWTGDQTFKQVTETQVTKTGSFTPDLTSGTMFRLTAVGTVTMPTKEAGKSFTVVVTVGTRVTWGGSPKWNRSTEPTKSSGTDIYSFWSDGVEWYGGQAGTNFG